MAKAQRAIEIGVPPERFVEVLQDYARYPEFLPEVKAVRVGERRGDAVQVTYWLDARIKLLELTLQHERRGPRELAWRLVRGELMELDQGTWTLRDTESGGTHATYTIELRMTGHVPQTLERALGERGLPRMLANFKARAETLFGGRGRPPGAGTG